jgi:hypothetical protein
MERERLASDKLGALIDERVADALANERAAMCASIVSVATVFAELEHRLTALDAAIEPRVKAVVKAALARNEREQLEAVAGVVRDVLADFIGEFRQLRKLIEGKLAPFDPAARNERPN